MFSDFKKRKYDQIMGQRGNVSSVLNAQGLQNLGGTVLGTITKQKTGSKGSIDKFKSYRKRLKVHKPELKYLDNQFGFSFSGVGTATLLNGIAQGTGPNQRVGNQVVGTSIQQRLTVTVGSLVTNPVYYRIIVFQDRQANGALPLAIDLLANGLTAVDYMISPLKLENSKRFKVIWDHTDSLDVGQGTANFENHFHGLPNMVQKFTGTSSAITSISTNALYFMIAATDTVFVNNYCRYRYFDL